MTTAKRRWIARTGVTLALLLTAFAALLGPAAPASAHAVLGSSTPAADQVLSTAPAKVVLTFTESVREVPGTIRVIGPDGKRVDRGDPTFDGATVTIAVDPGGPRGTYLVSYRVISADSHPVAGGYSYSVGAPSATPSDTDAGAASTDRAVQVAVSVAKFLGYAGLLLLFGGALVGLLLWPRRLSRAGPARVVALGAGLVAVATLAGIWLQMPYTTGGGLFAISGGELTDVLSSDFGAVHLVRLAVLGAAFAILWPLLRPLPVPVTEGAAPAPTGSAAPATGEDGSADGNAGSTGAGPARSDHPLDRVGRSDKLLLALLAVGGLATWPLAGHAAATPLPPVSVLADTVHRGAMAVWVGGLVMLAVFLLRRANARELGAILPIWAGWAAASVSALVIAGATQGLIEVGGVKALFTTTYGRLLIAKLVLFGSVILTAAYSRYLVNSGTAPVRPSLLRRAVLVEIGVTAAVLAISSVLVQTTPARTAEAQPADTTNGVFSTTLTSPLYSLQVTVDPAKVGNNSVHLVALTPDNKPLPVVEWQASAGLPAQGIEPIDIPLLPLTDDHATGEINLPAAGDWQLRFTLRLSDIDQATVTATVPIT